MGFEKSFGKGGMFVFLGRKKNIERKGRSMGKRKGVGGEGVEKVVSGIEKCFYGASSSSDLVMRSPLST